MDKLPLSVIIPSRHRACTLLRTIESVLSQTFSHFEILIIEQSDIETFNNIKAAIDRMPRRCRVQLIHIEKSGVCNARNEGIARARGEVILFLDDDVLLLRPDFLAAHLGPYARARCGGVTGRTVERIVKENAKHTTCKISLGGRTVANLLGQEPTQLQALKGANMSIRAELFHKCGGFDRNYTGTALLEEPDLSQRIINLGYELWFEPRAELLHLSACQGGNRSKGWFQTEHVRFRNTTYFVLKHRNWLGLFLFAVVHILIALDRSIKFRDPFLPVKLWRAALEGYQAYCHGPDDKIPWDSPSTRSTDAARPNDMTK